jgi:hypothetical protein
VLEAVVGGVAVLLVLIGLGIMAGPALPRALRLLRTHVREVAPAPAAPDPTGVHPTTGKALSATGRLIDLLNDQGLKRHATALRLAGTRLRREEANGIYAMRDVLRHLRRVRLDDAQDQEIFEGLIQQITKALDDRAEQLELLPRG